MRVRTLHKNALSEAMGALSKLKNTLAKQCAPALCTKTRQAEQRERSHSSKTRWQSKMRLHFAQKRTKRSNGSAPKAQNYAGEAMRVRTLYKNAPGGATGVLAKVKNTLAEQNAPALCTKSHQRHTVRDMGVGVSV